MSISEVKELTKYLTDEEVEQIKKEIKDKEGTLKGGNLNEEEMIQVLNTLFAVLVIEKALESEKEGIEEIRDELQAELLECYEVYDTYMAKFRNQDKKKKKKWFLSFLGLSEDISKRKNDIGASNRAIDNIQRELNNLKHQKSDEHLKEVVSKKDPNSVEKYSGCVHDCKNPHHHTRECNLSRGIDLEHRAGRGRHHHSDNDNNRNAETRTTANNQRDNQIRGNVSNGTREATQQPPRLSSWKKSERNAIRSNSRSQ